MKRLCLAVTVFVQLIVDVSCVFRGEAQDSFMAVCLWLVLHMLVHVE